MTGFTGQALAGNLVQAFERSTSLFLLDPGGNVIEPLQLATTGGKTDAGVPDGKEQSV